MLMALHGCVRTPVTKLGAAPVVQTMLKLNFSTVCARGLNHVAARLPRAQTGASRWWLWQRSLGNGALPTTVGRSAVRDTFSAYLSGRAGAVCLGVGVAAWAHSHRAVCAAAVAPRDARQPATAKLAPQGVVGSLEGAADLDLAELLNLLWPDLVRSVILSHIFTTHSILKPYILPSLSLSFIKTFQCRFRSHWQSQVLLVRLWSTSN